MTRFGLLLAVTIAACGGSPAYPAPPGPSPARVEERRAEEAKQTALAALEPPMVQPQDRAAYFEAVIRQGFGHRDNAVPRDPDPIAVHKVLLLDAIAGNADPVLQAKIREWLLDRGHDFSTAYALETPAILALPPDAPWQRAVTEWGRWLTGMLPALNEDELATADMIVDQSSNTPHAFPTVDRFLVGFKITDRWIQAGHPKPDRSHRAFEDVVCDVDEQYGKLSPSCGSHQSWWYRDALANDEATRRLAKVVVKWRDPAVTRAVIVSCAGSPKTLTLLAALESDPAVWHDAVLAVALVDDYHWLQDWLVPELKKKWRAQPSSRGTILYALAEASGQYADENEVHGMIDWTHFARDFEGGVTRNDFVSFLTQSPYALDRARWVMAARTKGWSTADAILPDLDAYFALPKIDEHTPGFNAIPGYLCYHDHDLAGLAKLREYFAKRAPSHPGDPLNVLMDSYTAKTCHAR